MNLNEQQLKELELLAGLFFSVTDIMISLDIPLHLEGEFTDIIKYRCEHPAYTAFQRGRITSQTQLRQSIKQAALNGSNPAQSTMIEFYNNSNHE